MMIRKLIVKGKEIFLFDKDDTEYIILTDTAISKDTQRRNYMIQNGICTRNIIALLPPWEIPPHPKSIALHYMLFKMKAGVNTSVKTLFFRLKVWINKKG